MTELQIFSNEEFQVRTVEIDGKLYFVGLDVAKTLGYSNPSKAVIQHCKGITKTGIPSGGDFIVTESTLMQGSRHILIRVGRKRSLRLWTC